MKNITSLLLFSALLLNLNAFAGGAKLVKGNLSFLKGAGTIKIEFDYTGLAVGDYKNEQEYIDKKVKEYNKDEAGRGDKWKEAWFNDRSTRYEPKFIELINEYSKANNLTYSKEAESKYVMVVKTAKIEPGFNVGVARKNAYTDYVIYFYAADDTERKNPLAQIDLKGMPGATAFGMDFDTGARISESYAKAGKELGQFFEKNLK